MEFLGHASVPVDEVQNFVEQQQHGSLCGCEYFGERVGSRRRGPRCFAECRNAPITGQLASQIDPWGFPALGRVPSIADEDTDSGHGRFPDPGFPHKIGHAGKSGGVRPCVGKVIERSEGVGLAAAELGYQREHRSRVLRFGGQAAQDHAAVLLQCTREAGA